MQPALRLPVGLAVAGLLTLSGCGKKGPLVYPDLLVPEAPQAVQLEQRGSSLQLSFNLPGRDLRGRGLQEPFVIEIQRRELKPDEVGECGSCPRDYQPPLRIDPEFPEPARKFGKRLVLLDSDVQQGKRYQYRMVAIGADGEAGAAVETVRAMVCAAPPTPSLNATVQHGGVIALEVQGQVPDNAELVGYAIYRAAGDEELPFQPLATTQGTNRYLDQNVQPGTRYRYVVRTLVRGWDELLLSSEPSAVVVVSLDEAPK